MNRLKLAVVGAGALGRHHVRILSGFEDVELLAVAESRADAGQAIAAQFGCRWVADYRELTGCVDAAVIAVPTFAHEEVAADFLECGVSLLVEKPLAPSAAGARRLVELAESNHCLLQVGHVERFNPALQAARPLIVAPKYIRAERISPYAFRSTDIGVVHDMMIHDLDLVLAIADSRVLHVEAFGVCVMGGHEDCVQARLRFANGCIADLAANRVSPVSRRTMQVWSAGGCIGIDFSTREVVHYSPGPALLYGTPPVERARQPGADIDQLKAEVFGTMLKVDRPVAPAGDALTDELRSFVDCVACQRPPLVSGRVALAVLTVADDILAAVQNHLWDGNALGPRGPELYQPERRKLAG